MNDDPIIRLSVPRREAEDAATAPRRKPPALGRGLGALMGESRREQAFDQGDNALRIERGFALVSISAIEPHPANPRRHFDEAALDELAASIAQRGVIQPIIVRPKNDGRYQLVAGERRWRAAQRAQLHEIPALVRDLTDRDVLALALIENLQREDLNPIEEARAYQRLAELEGLTQAEIAKLVDKSRSHVANLQRLLALPEAILAMVEGAELSMGHARALIGVAGAEEIARKAVATQMSVRDVERLVRREARGPSNGVRRARTDSTSADAADIAAVQDHLEEFLGLPVRIATDVDPRSGAVTIRYTTLDQLDLICQRLTGGGI